MRIKMLVMDVDGTLTDGKIYIGENGEIMKAFNVKDGYGIVSAKKHGIVPVIITGRKSKIVEERAKELGIDELYQGVDDKVRVLKEAADKCGVSFDQVAYIGDDLNDLGCIEVCGLTGCPGDAAKDVVDRVDYVCKCFGGYGAVREFISYVLNYVN